MIRRDGLFCSGCFVVCCNRCVFGCDSHSFFFCFFENFGRVFVDGTVNVIRSRFSPQITSDTRYRYILTRIHAHHHIARRGRLQAFNFTERTRNREKSTTILLFCSFILIFFNKQKSIAFSSFAALVHLRWRIVFFFVEANEFLRWCGSVGVRCSVRTHQNSLLFWLRACEQRVQPFRRVQYCVPYTRPSNEKHENPSDPRYMAHIKQSNNQINIIHSLSARNA